MKHVSLKRLAATALILLGAFYNGQCAPTGTAGDGATALLLKGIVYHDLLDAHRKGNTAKNFGLYCLEENEQQEYWRSLFTNSVPRIDIGTNNVVVTKYVLVDRLTNKAAKRFWARVASVSNNIAEVRGGWYTGPRASETLNYELRFIKGKWIIVKRTTIIMS